MKIEIVNRRNAVEVRQLNEDGTMTVYLCENPQAALFKIASLVYSIEEPPEEAKRSILVGTFGEKKKEPKRPALEELSKQISEEFKKKGIFKLQDFTPPEEAAGPLVPSGTPLPLGGGGQINIIPMDINTIPCGIAGSGGVGSGDQPTIDVHLPGSVDTGSAPADGSSVNLSEILDGMKSSKINCFGIQDEELGGENLAMFSAEFGPSSVKVFKTTLSANS